MKKVLIIGSGGREHALGWNISRSGNIEILYAPGNGGTEQERNSRNVAMDIRNFSEIAKLVKKEKIDLTIVGPEEPLADGLVDYLYNKGCFSIFGPTQEAAKIESDKFYSYDIMQQLNIPQAYSIKCESSEQAVKAINEIATENGVVLKARGLTGGKGVTVCSSKEQALSTLEQHIINYGSHLLVAERLFGEEFSVFGIANGERVYPLGMAFQDRKSLLDNNQGPNTGGMGACGPVPFVSISMVNDIVDRMMTPIIKNISKDSDADNYHGFLYAGMILTQQGPKVLEYNVRFGDPECQPAMMLLRNNLYDACSSALNGGSAHKQMSFDAGSACCVVLTSPGYPGEFKKGLPISGLEEVSKMHNIKVFHAGTKKDGEQIITTGGRVLGVTAYSPFGIEQARNLAYEAAYKLSIPGGFHYRRDIGSKAVIKH